MKRGMALILTFALFWAVMSAIASGVPGSAADPLVTVGFLRDKFTPAVTAEASKRAAAALDEKNAQLDLSRLSKPSQALTDAAYSKTKEIIKSTNGKFHALNVTPNQTLSLSQGSLVILTSGSASLSKSAVDLTTGADISGGASLPADHDIMLADSGGSITFTSAATLFVNGQYVLITETYTPKNTALADTLKSMGLFRGSDIGYELERAATRVEMLYMTLYLMGEIGVAEVYSGAQPFNDVPSWASNAVAYSYYMGYTKGVSSDSFDPSRTSTVEQYAAMLLRVLGYDDTNGDFSWDKSMDFAVSIGLFTYAEKAELESGAFLRDDMVYMSYYTVVRWDYAVKR